MQKHVINIGLIVILAILIFILSGSGPLLAASLTAKGTDTVRMVLVLDASGSMWGQIDGKAKIEIAKEVMAELIDQIPADFQTGLTVYGHRRKGDCKDIEMVIPVGPHNATAMKAKVQGISPKGKTPLSESVKQAAQALRYTEERATVILVSDGLETCDIDPCALAAELAMSGVDFTVHVIGFDISKEDQARLRCLADKTGGLFLAASNAGSLRDALFKTVEEVKAPPPPVVEDPGTAVLEGPAGVPAGAAFSVQWEGPDSRGDYIAIAKKGSPLKVQAPSDPGTYEVRYILGRGNKLLAKTTIEIKAVSASVKTTASADMASLFEVSWQGLDNQSDYIAIARPDQKPGRQVHYTYTQKGSPLKVQAPSDPGTYEVRYILGQGSKLLAKTTIEIKAVSAKVQPPASANVNAEFEVKWQGPDYKSDYISIARTDQGSGSYITYTYTYRGNPVKMKAPKVPGVYEVRYILGQGSKVLDKANITIK